MIGTPSSHGVVAGGAIISNQHYAARLPSLSASFDSAGVSNICPLLCRAPPVAMHLRRVSTYMFPSSIVRLTCATRRGRRLAKNDIREDVARRFPYCLKCPRGWLLKRNSIICFEMLYCYKHAVVPSEGIVCCASQRTPDALLSASLYAQAYPLKHRSRSHPAHSFLFHSTQSTQKMTLIKLRTKSIQAHIH
jgi:hypothetical protein